MLHGRDESIEEAHGAPVSVSKLAELLNAVEPDRTVTVHVSASGEIRPVSRQALRSPTSLREAAESLSEAMAAVIDYAFRNARTVDEINDMTDLSVCSNNWMQGICLGLGIDIFEETSVEPLSCEGEPPKRPVDDGSPVSYCDFNGCSFGYGHSGPHSLSSRSRRE